MKPNIPFNDYPIEEVVKQAEEVVKKGGIVHQKWTCRHCKTRQTMETPNKFYSSGKCEICNEITIIDKCNYLFFMSRENVENSAKKDQDHE